MDSNTPPPTPSGQWWCDGEEDLSGEYLMLKYQCWRWRILYALAALAIWGGWPG